MSIALSDEDKPLVSVIIPAFNAEAFIADTLDSVLAQTYSSLEVIVTDDGSTDRTVEIVDFYRSTDSRVALIKQKNAGVAAARNLAIQAARGEFIAPVDADDIWYPQKLERQMQVMLQSDENVGLVYAWSVYINEDGSLTDVCQINNVEGELFIPLLHGNLLGNASSALIRRACFERIGGYKSELKEQNAQGCEDWDMYLRIAEHYEFRVVPELLVGYRQVLGSMSFDYDKMMRSCELVLLEMQQQHPEIPDKVFRWTRSNFNWYLALRSDQQSDRLKTISYLLQAACLDYMPLLRPRYYILMLKSAWSLLTNPFLVLFKPLWLSQPNPVSKKEFSLTLDELNEAQSKSHQRFPRKHYSDFLKYRWDSVRREIKKASPADKSATSVLTSLPKQL